MASSQPSATAIRPLLPSVPVGPIHRLYRRIETFSTFGDVSRCNRHKGAILVRTWWPGIGDESRHQAESTRIEQVSAVCYGEPSRMSVRTYNITLQLPYNMRGPQKGGNGSAS